MNQNNYKRGKLSRKLANNIRREGENTEELANAAIREETALYNEPMQ
jgi:hypothetical protein